MKVKPGLHCRPQDAGDARATGHLPKGVANGVEPARERELCDSQKIGRAEPSNKPLNTRHGAAEFGVCPHGFWSYFGVIFHYAPFPPFCNDNVYFVPLNFESTEFVLILWSITVKRLS